ncbi:MAG: NUDIX domain-containing protein [Gammaproteobacteria bacterium]
MTERRLKARIVSRTPLHEGFLKVYRYRFEVERHTGGTRQIEWELMERGNSVAVLGHDPKRDEVVLGNEFRPGAFVSGEYAYREQLIAGTIDSSESPIDAAAREMREETGLVLRDPVLVHPGAYVSSGGTSEKIASYMALWIRALQVALVVSARVKTSLPSFCRRNNSSIALLSGEINDFKTLLAGYWLAARR